jgi:hypothetical protein
MSIRIPCSGDRVVALAKIELKEKYKLPYSSGYGEKIHAVQVGQVLTIVGGTGVMNPWGTVTLRVAEKDRPDTFGSDVRRVNVAIPMALFNGGFRLARKNELANILAFEEARKENPRWDNINEE